ncbi:UPF0687 protein C20orf27 homolog [Daphnia magna]|uniref:Adipose-secreted signaling protein n=1 Tax=Daphnia magna TaxID=35525 RepID=A0ABR0AUW2_9CRUS|nr:UPF0687 protein C20orf27 homolog [Daphnia magna]KAK4028898.1 hypothetical protein OUZ56_021917 [Daphnia magna]
MAGIEEEQHHVKFIEETGTFGKENTINIQKLSQWSLQAHLGFLKLNHSYEICLSLDNPMTKDNSRWLANDSTSKTYSSVKCCENEDSKINLHIILRAGKPKLMKELIKLTCSTDSSVHLEITLLARVLGKGQGTPMLKDGIHCIGAEVDEEAEASDWQGFD